MKITLVYLHVVGKSDPTCMDPTWYLPCAQRFIRTYRQCPLAQFHQVAIVSCGGPINDYTRNLFNDIATLHLEYRGPGWDIGAYQHAANQLDADWLVFLSTPSHFRREGWLDVLVKAFEQYGDGLYSSAGSNEHVPHLRSSCFACTPQHFRAYPVLIDSREKCFNFEAGITSKGQPFNGGRMSFTNWTIAQGKPAMSVHWNFNNPAGKWREGPNIFRRGDQSQMLVFDRHSDMYEMGSAEQKHALAQWADAGHFP